jgi:cytochrome P450/NADPH-cytochrome P450 reductase
LTTTIDQHERGAPPAPEPGSETARILDPAAMPEYGWEEILRHDKPGDYWVVFQGGVYDVSDWLHRHPGGVEILVEQYGRDATAIFEEIGHSEAALHLVGSFQVGRLRPGAIPPAEVPTPAITADLPAPPGPGAAQSGPKIGPLPGDAADERHADAVADREVDWEEILRHDSAEDFWVVIAGGVYDVSEWMYHHPGGAEVLVEQYGHDATAAFNSAGHSDEAWNLTETFRVGRLRPGSKRPHHVKAPAIAKRPPGGHGAHAGEPVEIPYAVRWLVPDGERLANYGVIDDNDEQLDYYRRFGHVYAVGIPTKKWRIVMVSDPLLLDEVAGNEEQFGKRVDEINFFDQLGRSRGGGISVVSDGPSYDRVRRVMLPWYAPAHQKTQFERMKAVARQMLDAWATIPDGEPLELREWMERYALEVSGRGACNYDFGLLDANADKAPFAAAVPESTKESIRRVADPRPDFTLLSRKAARARRKRYDRQNRLLFSTADALVRGRLNTCPAGVQTDLLTRLTTVPDPETGTHLDVDTVRDQILMHLSNGFNGPSIIGAWIGYLLATHPEVEEALIAEIDSVTGGDPAYELQYSDLMALPYTTQVIKETLRIYPPMPVTIRRSLKDGTLGPYRIRKDDIIFVGALAAQRDPAYWGPDAGEFDPDQFAMEKVVERPRHAFVPFSVGARQCMAQEVTFMMLRVVLFETYNRYRLRLAPGAKVVKNTTVTTKPAAVPVTRVLREPKEEREAAVALRRQAARVSLVRGEGAVGARAWDRPSEIPPHSTFSHLVVAYGSNFGSNRELAMRFAERSGTYGFTSEVVSLNDLVDRPPRTQPWLLVVMTSTYTAKPPGNAIAFKAWLERTEPGCENWKNCRYFVWGLGNTQWNAFLAFPRYVHARLGELGATPLGELGFGDVGSPVWEDAHVAWNDRAWPTLIDLAGARPSEAAAARVAAEQAAHAELAAAGTGTGAEVEAAEGDVIAPTILTNPVGIETVEVRVVDVRELQSADSSARTRHLELSVPADLGYTAGDHIGICPQNDEAAVAWLAARLGVPLEGIFTVPKAMKVNVVPRGVPLQVRNVLTNLVDISSLPTLPFLDLLLAKVHEPHDRARLEEIRNVLSMPGGPASPLRSELDAGGFDVVRLLEELPECAVTLLELLVVLQPLRPRYYSTSSSPRVHGADRAQLTIGRQDSQVPGRPGRPFCGMCARYVHSLRVGDRVNVFLDRAEGFHLRQDVGKPMIFVSAGTGFAPMRAFLWERYAMRQEGTPMGPAALFNGIRHSDLDYIYRDEIEMFEAEGVVDHVQVATSREVPGVRDYVQDRLRRHGDLLWDWIGKGGYVYVCGSQSMRAEVRAAFLSVFAEHGGLSPEEAESLMGSLEGELDRYRPDVWG